MTNNDILLLFTALVIGVLLWWAYYTLNSEDFWGETFDMSPRPPKAPSKPRLYRTFGPHVNPLALQLNYDECDGEFEQMDERTWQCVRCQLLHFEKP